RTGWPVRRLPGLGLPFACLAGDHAPYPFLSHLIVGRENGKALVDIRAEPFEEAFFLPVPVVVTHERLLPLHEVPHEKIEKKVVLGGGVSTLFLDSPCKIQSHVLCPRLDQLYPHKSAGGDCYCREASYRKSPVSPECTRQILRNRRFPHPARYAYRHTRFPCGTGLVPVCHGSVKKCFHLGRDMFVVDGRGKDHPVGAEHPLDDLRMVVLSPARAFLHADA